MDSFHLKSWGWNAVLQESFVNLIKNESTSTLISLGRIVAEYRDQYEVITEKGFFCAEVRGSFRHQVQRNAEFPVVGDWVLLSEVVGGHCLFIQRVLPRISALSRKSPGLRDEEQVMVSNVDLALLVLGSDQELNIRKVERFLAMIAGSQILPIILLTKVDLLESEEVSLRHQELMEFFPQISCLPFSTLHKESIQGLLSLLAQRTSVLLGVSGAGKSSVINALLNKNLQNTQEVRFHDGKGRHTTTRRQLFFDPEYEICIIDTPGLRELQIFDDAEESLEELFGEIIRWGSQCKFQDCSHQKEPGCAVQEALRSELLDPSRLESYQKLLNEKKNNQKQYHRNKDSKNREQKQKDGGRSMRKKNQALKKTWVMEE